MPHFNKKKIVKHKLQAKFTCNKVFKGFAYLNSQSFLIIYKKYIEQYYTNF